MLRSIQTLLRSIVGRKHFVTRRNRRTVRTLPVCAVERLEERVLLAVLTWTGAADTNFFKKENWKDAAGAPAAAGPGAADTVKFIGKGTAAAHEQVKFNVADASHTYTTTGSAGFIDGYVDIDFQDPNPANVNTWVLKGFSVGVADGAVVGWDLTRRTGFLKLSNGDTRAQGAVGNIFVGLGAGNNGTLEIDNHTLMANVITVADGSGIYRGFTTQGLLKARGSATTLEGGTLENGYFDANGTVDIDGIETFNFDNVRVGGWGGPSKTAGTLKIYNMNGAGQTAYAGFLSVRSGGKGGAEGSVDIFNTHLVTETVTVGDRGKGELYALYSTITTTFGLPVTIGDQDPGSGAGPGEGAVFLQGSVWEVTGAPGASGRINVGKNAKNGTLDIDTESTVKSDVHVYNKGTLNGANRVQGKVVKEGPGAKVTLGSVNAASPIAQFTVEGDYDATLGGTLFVELAGAMAPGIDYDQLIVESNANLGGTLDVKSINGYVPPNVAWNFNSTYAENLANGAAAYEVLTTGVALGGEFGALSPPQDPLPLGLNWDVWYGDLDEDGDDGAWVLIVGGDSPTAFPDQYSVLHENTIDTAFDPNDEWPSVLANDYDPYDSSGIDLRALLVSTTTNGVLAFDEYGHFTYTPAPNFVGTDFFTYKAHRVGESDYSNVVSVTIDVTNTPPLTGDDYYLIDHDTQLTDAAPGVLANDWDDEDPITAVLLDDVDNGVLSLAGDGGFTYTPNAGFVGFDYFTYAADDGFEQSLATVEIEVYNDIPSAADDFYSIPIDTSLNEPAPGVMANDFDVDPLQAFLISGVSNGGLTFSSSGAFDYVPNPGFSGLDSFSYYVSDGIADSAPATVTIDVYDMGGGSLFAADDFYITSPDTPYSEPPPGVMANDTLAGSTIAVLDANAVNGFVVLESGGGFTYTPDTGFSGLDTFTYHLEDGAEFSNVATVEITVGDPQPEPLLAAGPGGDGTFEPLQRSQLVAIVDQAIAQWDAVIADPGVRRAMRAIDFKIVDLPGNTLAVTFPTMIVIDVDAAGYGWFVDATPGATEEFQFNRRTGQYEATAGPAADRMDLLTVVLHELGHVAGFADESPRTTQPGDVMLGILDVGTRRLPNASHTFRFLDQQFEALIARLPDEKPSDPAVLRQHRRELDSLLSQIGRHRAAVRATRPALELDALDGFFATLEDRKELLLWG